MPDLNQPKYILLTHGYVLRLLPSKRHRIALRNARQQNGHFKASISYMARYGSFSIYAGLHYTNAFLLYRGCQRTHLCQTIGCLTGLEVNP